MSVILGAPNIIKGGSHSNNLSAMDAIRDGYANIICSDYMATSMLYAVFKLVSMKMLGLHSAVNMISLNPANAVNLGKSKGSLEQGKDADMILVDGSFEVPVIEKVFIKGGRGLSQGQVMKIGLISDIHGNFAALGQVIRELRSRGR